MAEMEQGKRRFELLVFNNAAYRCLMHSVQTQGCETLLLDIFIYQFLMCMKTLCFIKGIIYLNTELSITQSQK